MFKFLGGFVDSNEKEIKRLQPWVEAVNELEAEFQKLTDDELRAKTEEFRGRLRDGEDLDDLLPEAFAAVREAARRTLGQRHYDVQIMGGVTLHQGKIAEMKTGEGKTMVATLPLYLNCLSGEGVHLVTVNDYLARRDPYWMGPIYHALGVSVASIYPMQSSEEHMPARLYDPDYDSGKENDRWRHFRPVSRKEAYQADITYGTSSEFGFDHLRDNMVVDPAQCVQRPLNYAIVDEVDNLLIDEARTPLIISAPDAEAGQLYKTFAQVARNLRPDTDYEAKAKERNVELTETGWDSVERLLRRDGILKPGDSLYTNSRLMHHLRNALSAKEFFKKDHQYVVERSQGKAEIIIVDDFTGRKMIGRRYSEGLHQAIEAKEGVPVQQESRTYATITIQNYFRMYRKLSGMTGTALTEAEEFHKIYKLEVTPIPTNKPNVREDHPDLIYKNEEAKYRAVVREIKRLNKLEAPVLVGTVSIEKSEYLSDLLKKQGIACNILNAKEHTREGEIIAGAGKPGAVTVATNMAGRGVDILLGGSRDGDGDNWQEKHDKVIAGGGLHIIGTERHEARRIDNQLRGRAGRQGDPGTSRFFVSLEDDIMRRFGGDRIKSVMGWVGMDEDTPIENNMITKAITDVQKRVEGYHFDMRKHLVEYDDVVNKHRELIYEERRKILGGADLRSNILDMVAEEMRGMTAARLADQHGIDWDIPGLLADAATVFPLPPSLKAEDLAELSSKEIPEKLIELSVAAYDAKEQELGAEDMRMVERVVMLRVIDQLWVEHLTAMEHSRLEAGWQTLRQTRSVDAYKSQGYEQFQTLLATIQHDVAHTIFHVAITRREGPEPEKSEMAEASGRTKADNKPREKAAGRKVGRNDPCPCGSGKKYKHCCGK